MIVKANGYSGNGRVTSVGYLKEMFVAGQSGVLVGVTSRVTDESSRPSNSIEPGDYKSRFDFQSIESFRFISDPVSSLFPNLQRGVDECCSCC